MRPSWLLEAEKELGTHEVAGSKANARIIQYWHDNGLEPSHAAPQGDETPWCAAFMGAMLSRAGLPATHFTLAKQFLNYGQRLSYPIDGAIVILNRKGGLPWQGHVGICVGANDKYIDLLGGNQGDAVSKAAFSRDRIAGIRWPLGIPIPETRELSPLNIVGGTDPKDR